MPELVPREWLPGANAQGVTHRRFGDLAETIECDLPELAERSRGDFHRDRCRPLRDIDRDFAFDLGIGVAAILQRMLEGELEIVITILVETRAFLGALDRFDAGIW